MPAVQARSYAQPEVAPRPQKRGDVRLVSDRTQQRKRASQIASTTLAYQKLFRSVVAAVAVLMLLGLGSVFINAEATRCSQQSALINADISRETARAQALELNYATLRSSERIEKIASKELGMVAAGAKVSAIDIGTDEHPQTKAVAPRKTDNSTLTRLARLTTGEASALLVGDINLALSR